MGRGAMAGRPACHAGAGAAAAGGHCGPGACAQRRDRRDGARVFPLGLVARDVLRERTGVDERDRLAGGALRVRQIHAARPHLRPVSADRQQPVRGYLHEFCGTAVRIEIERATGALRIAKAYSVLDCGQPLVPNLVLGQAQGAFAMGVGYALLENLPPFETGPGNGQWNLGDYVIARGSDMPLHDLEIELLPPVDAKEAPKGAAEVGDDPGAAALLNAIFDATGKRFQSLPVTEKMLKGALS